MIDFVTQSEQKKFEKPVFMNFEYGQHRVRLLGETRGVWTHFLRGRATIECLGADCPICQQNKLLRAQAEGTKAVAGVIPSSYRVYVNALDRTPVKVCPNCQTENKKTLAGVYAPQCKSCATFITDVEPVPSEKVKILNLSNTNAQKLVYIQSSNRDENDNPIGLENYDVLFMVMQAGDRKDISPSGDFSANDKVEVPEDALFDLDNVVISLEPDEIGSLLSGVQLKDIFAARKTSEGVLDEISSDISEEISEKLDKLFEQESIE